MCEPGSLGAGYHRYVFDAGRRCLTSSIPSFAHVEGGGCQPGLAHTEAEYFTHFFNMLVRVARGEDCDREHTRRLSIEEVHAHAKLLRDRVTLEHANYARAAKAVHVSIIVLAALTTAFPVAFISLYLILRSSFPSLPMCAFATLASSIALLIFAVIRRKINSAILLRARRLEPLKVVLADVIESPDTTQLRKRVDAHLHKGNLHAAFELNRPEAWSFSGQCLLIATIVFCVVAAAASAAYFDVIRSVRDLRGVGTLRVGGGFGINTEALHTNAVSGLVLVLAVSGVVVAWQDIV